jgi:hypothetical protein
MARADAMNDRVLPPAYSLTQVVERLPAHAQQKYQELKGQLSDAEALQRSLMDRIKEAEDKAAHIARRRSYSNDTGLDAELEACRASLDRLERERTRRNGIRANTEQVVSRINNFLLARMSGAADIAPPPRLRSLPAARRKGESIGDALLRVRREIAAAKAELLQIKSAPPPSDEIKIAIIETVKALAEEGRPRVTSDGGKVALHLPDVPAVRLPILTWRASCASNHPRIAHWRASMAVLEGCTAHALLDFTCSGQGSGAEGSSSRRVRLMSAGGENRRGRSSNVNYLTLQG